MTDRKKTTQLLSDLLIVNRFSGMGKYWAREVTLNYGTDDVRRVDFMQFTPENQLCVAGIEKGYFTCYEIKSCKEDFYSGFGQNFVGEKNYLVMTMDTWKAINKEDIPWEVGVMVAVPKSRNTEKGVFEEFTEPTTLSDTESLSDWDFYIVKPGYKSYRKKSMTELLFCMLRAGR